jgi:hypothetical protein
MAEHKEVNQPYPTGSTAPGDDNYGGLQSTLNLAPGVCGCQCNCTGNCATRLCTEGNPWSSGPPSRRSALHPSLADCRYQVTAKGVVFDASQGVQSGTVLKLSQTTLRTFSLPAVTEIEARCSFSSASPLRQLRFVIHHITAQIGNPHTGR